MKSNSEPSAQTQRELTLGLVHLVVPTLAMALVCFVCAVPNDSSSSSSSSTTSSSPSSTDGVDAEAIAAVSTLDSAGLLGHALEIIFSLLYTAVGTLNIVLLYTDTKLGRRMKYTNSIMAWSAFFFGPLQIAFRFAPYTYPVRFDQWDVVPNFGWGVEWGLQLLYTAGSSWRALAIMSASIASYFVKFAFPEGNETGFYLIFVPQLVGALIMCGICFYKFRSRAAGIQLGCFIVACFFFSVLHFFEAPEGWGAVIQGCLIKCCDCSQIHFSIRLYVSMFETKTLEASLKQDGSGGWDDKQKNAVVKGSYQQPDEAMGLQQDQGRDSTLHSAEASVAIV